MLGQERILCNQDLQEASQSGQKKEQEEKDLLEKRKSLQEASEGLVKLKNGGAEDVALLQQYQFSTKYYQDLIQGANQVSRAH